MKKPDGPRDPVAGPAEGPPAPYPIKLRGPVIKGFGRGSRELGIPTANIPPSGLDAYPDLESGVYFGYVGLLPLGTASPSTYPAVLSIGYNPFYKNKTRSVEIHILHKFHTDFYSASLNLLILGFVRPEYDYNSLESLIDDIMFDCDVARKSLSRPAYVKFEGDRWLTEFGWKETTNVEEIEKEVLGQKRAVE